MEEELGGKRGAGIVFRSFEHFKYETRAPRFTRGPLDFKRYRPLASGPYLHVCECPPPPPPWVFGSIGLWGGGLGVEEELGGKRGAGIVFRSFEHFKYETRAPRFTRGPLDFKRYRPLASGPYLHVCECPPPPHGCLEA